MPFNIFSLVILEADLIDIGHLDPLERHKGRSNLGHYGYINHRYSSFKVSRIPDIFCFEVLKCTDLIQLKKVYSVTKNDDKISLYRSITSVDFVKSAFSLRIILLCSREGKAFSLVETLDSLKSSMSAQSWSTSQFHHKNEYFTDACTQVF